MKIIHFFRNTVRFLKMLMVDYSKAPYILFLYAYSGAIRPYWNIVFAAKILDSLLIYDYKSAIWNTFFLISGTLFFGIIYKTMQTYKHIYQWTLDESLARQVMDKAYKMEYDVFETTEAMDHLRIVRNQVSYNGGANNIWWSLNEFLKALFGVIFALFFLVRMVLLSGHWHNENRWLVYILVAFLILIIWIRIYYSKKDNELFDLIEKENIHTNAVWDYLSSISLNITMKKDVMLCNIEDLLIQYFERYENQFINKYNRWNQIYSRHNAVFSWLISIYSSGCYIVAGINALAHLLPVSEVLLYAGSMQKLAANLTECISQYTNLLYKLQFLNGYYDYIHQPPMHYTGTLPIEKRKDNDYELEFRNVSFRYPGSDPYVLKDINLKFNVGQKLALVGRNGAGKTTIVKLLCRLYEPTEGEILLNGISIWKYDYAEYTRIFAPVFQDFKLFSMPVAENIASSTEYDESRIQKALEKAGIWDRVQQMKDGIHTQMYHNNGDGVEISGGEAQKLAIARAWYKDAPFIILDEPTAALDPLAEAEIYENFNSLIENKTAIYISHRMSSCKFCDSIVVMKDGEITEQGTHTELLSRNGEYAALYNAQAAYYN